MSHDEVSTPPDVWASVPDATDVCQVKFANREEALQALEGAAGSVLRCRKGYPREGLEFLFDVEALISGLESRAMHGGWVLANFEDGLFDAVSEVEENDLRRRLADAIADWVRSVNPTCWTILEAEDIEVATNAQNILP